MVKIHVIPNPSGITGERYRLDAFGVAASKFIKTMPTFGYEIIHYGHELSEVECEHHTVVSAKDYPPPKDTGTCLTHNNTVAEIFCNNLEKTLIKTLSPDDIVACFYGNTCKKVVEKFTGSIITEPSIGYNTSAIFAPCKAFVSSAWMHYYYGTKRQLMEPNWYDTIIPNGFDIDEFEFKEEKQNYFVYLGRVITTKGIDIAIQVTEKLGIKLIIAGPGKLKDIGYTNVPDHVVEIGYVDADNRKTLLSNAKCLMAPTYYIEPFGNIVVEAGLSGTPVLTTDWGGFCDTVVQGVTGYRCRDFNEFLEGGKSILAGQIKASDCRNYTSKNYNLDVVHGKMDSWFRKILKNDFYHIDQ